MIQKVKDNVFLKSTLILLFGGFAGKLIGFILKIIVTRNLGAEAMGLMSLLSPTTSLLSTIAVFSYPTSLSKLISDKSYRTKELFTSIIPISLTIFIKLSIWEARPEISTPNSLGPTVTNLPLKISTN